MPYTKQDIQNLHSLSDEDTNHTLAAAKLPLDKEIYTDEEIQKGVDVIRGYFSSGQAADYAAAAELFAQQVAVTQPTEPDTQAKAKKSKNGKKPSETMDFDSMQSWISKGIGTRISPIELGSIIQACGLPDQEEYTQSECDRVRDAASMFKNQGKSLATVADCFGKTNSDLDIEAGMQENLDMVGSAALATEEELIQALNKVAAKQGQDVSAIYQHLLLSHTAHQMREGRQAREKMAKFSEQLEAFIQGKSSIRRMSLVNPPALDQTNLKSLPESSDKL